MVGSDRQTGWREVGQHTVRKEEGEIIDGCWLKKNKKKRVGAVAIQKREDIRWKNYVLVIIITEHKTQTNKTFLAKGP